MYEKSKEKYAADMEEYTFNKSINAVQTPNCLSSQWYQIECLFNYYLNCMYITVYIYNNIINFVLYSKKMFFVIKYKLF